MFGRLCIPACNVCRSSGLKAVIEADLQLRLCPCGASCACLAWVGTLTKGHDLGVAVGAEIDLFGTAGLGGVIACLGWAGKLVVEPPLNQIGELLRKRVERFEQSLESRIDPEKICPSDRVNPRITSALLNQVAWTDDEIHVAYISGIFASSISVDGQDDRGLPHSALIARLHHDALVAHMVLYRAALEKCGNRWKHISVPHPLSELGNDTFEVAFDALIDVVGGSKEDRPDGRPWDRTIRALHLLAKEDLAGSPNKLPLGDGNKPYHPSYRYQVTPPGVELFLWGVGLGRHPTIVALNKYFDLVWDLSLPHISPVAE